MTSNGSNVPNVKIGFTNNAFLWSSCHRLSFWPWCSCDIEGILSVGWKTMKSTVDFYFFDLVNQTLCISFLLNFWTLQRSFCINKSRLDTSIYIRSNFLRYLLDGKEIFSFKFHYNLSLGKEVIVKYQYVTSCHSMWEQVKGHITKLYLVVQIFHPTVSSNRFTYQFNCDKNQVKENRLA